VLVFIFQTARLFRSLGRIFASDEGRGVGLLLTLQLLIGAIFYHQVEDWRWVDAFYFCVASLTTVGYGDLTPATDEGKIFTMVYLVTGIGLFVSFGAHVARELLDERARREKGHETT
jgi:voltage-gated potassium channel